MIICENRKFMCIKKYINIYFFFFNFLNLLYDVSYVVDFLFSLIYQEGHIVEMPLATT